jgi:hypothetical protein
LSKPVRPRSRPELPDVTLVAVTSVAVEATVAALHRSMRQVQFGEVLLLCDRSPPAGADPAIRWRPVERLTSRRDYSRFMLSDLAGHISTSHALCVQWDGFVLDGNAWEPHFLDYDYIGAVWPHFSDGQNVGNGGFSLRSRRLLEQCRGLDYQGLELEDVVISRLCRPRLEAQGIRFAPAAVAQRFAYERESPTGREFGFHGSYNLVRHLAPGEALHLFRSLEPRMLARNERFELFRWALARGRLGLALAMLARLI